MSAGVGQRWGTAGARRRVRLALRSRLRRLTRTPFDARCGRAVLVHGAHHKVATVWFGRVLSSVAGHYGLRFTEVPDSTDPSSAGAAPPHDVDVVLYARANDFTPADLAGRRYRGSHLVRDPRDVVVSGYYYHLRTDEPWAHEPSARYGGLSYQRYLRSVDEHRGLMAEIERSARSTLADMGAWPYGERGFLEMRYEDVVRDEEKAFTELFRFYGLDDAALRHALGIVEQFRRPRGQAAGAADPHVRSGEPGEWRRHLGAEHLAALASLTGDLVGRLGYGDGAEG